MQLFYYPDIDHNTKLLNFGKEESHHITKVLRKSVGDQIEITNGKGWLFRGELQSIERKKCSVKVLKATQYKNRNYNLHLAVAPTKMNDRYEWFLEKATEIGVDKITPVICDHSERRQIKPLRFEKIIQSAMKQSLQHILPILNEPTTFDAFINQTKPEKALIAHCESDKKRFSIRNAVQPREDVTVLIGPEGDFSTREINLALANGYQAVTLGTNRLRTETAAIAACHSIAFINE